MSYDFVLDNSSRSFRNSMDQREPILFTPKFRVIKFI